MPYTLRLEKITREEPSPVPPDFAPPSLERLDVVLDQRRRFFDQHSRRDALVELLLSEHKAQAAPPESLHHIERLADPGTFAVVTGQQPGLLTGPLYTPWKILSAILLARKLQDKINKEVVPVFWNAGEDHDTAEMDHFTWLDRAGQSATFRLALSSKEAPVSFGARAIAQLDPARLLEFWSQMLLETEFSADLRVSFHDALACSETLGEFCNQLLWRLFPKSGLIIVNSSNRSYPALVPDLLHREIEQPLHSTQRINQAAEELTRHHFKPKMHKATGRCSFFLYEGPLRSPVFFADGRFSSSVSTYTPEQLLRRLEKQPEDFSPAANLRPILQDALLPTAVNVLGPGELAYHLQLKEIYRFHSVPQPVAVERSSLTLLPPRVANSLAKLGLAVEQLQHPADRLAKQVVASQSPVDYPTQLAELKQSIHDRLDSLAQKARNLDKSLQPLIMNYDKRLAALLDKLDSRFSAGLKRRNQEIERSISRLQALVYPGGQPQERVLNLFMFLNEFGPDLLTTLLEKLRAFDSGSRLLVWIDYEDKDCD